MMGSFAGSDGAPALHAIPGFYQTCEALRHVRDRLLVRDAPGQPAFGRRVEDGAADGEALDQRLARAAVSKPLASSSSGASRPSSTMPRH